MISNTKRMELFQARIDCNMSQEKLAENAGISRTFYTQIENGTKLPSLEVALKLAKELKKTVEELFGYQI